MTPADVIRLARDADVELRVHEDRLQVLSRGPIPPGVAHHIRQNEAALVRLLVGDSADDDADERAVPAPRASRRRPGD